MKLKNGVVFRSIGTHDPLARFLNATEITDIIREDYPRLFLPCEKA